MPKSRDQTSSEILRMDTQLLGSSEEWSSGKLCITKNLYQRSTEVLSMDMHQRSGS